MVAMIDLLRKVGLNKYETQAYLALLNFGSSTAFKISKKSSVPYGRIYDSLNELVYKGFVEVVPTKPKKYNPVPASTAIKGLLDEQFNNLEKLRGEVDKEVKKFKKRVREDVSVSVNEGKKNFAKAVVEHLNYEKEFWATSEEFLLEKKYPALRRHIKLGENNRFVLVDINKSEKGRIAEVISEGLKVRHYPLENIRLLVSDRELVTISIQEQGSAWTNIHIKNKSLGKALTKMMRTIWKNSKKII